MTAHRVLKDMFKAGFEPSDPGDAGEITCERWGGVVPLVSAGAETRTLNDPEKAGLQITLAFKEDGGDCVVTATTAINQTGNTIMTFADAGDEITLRSIPKGSDFVWRVVSNDGVALS